MLVDLSSYYCSIFLVSALLWPKNTVAGVGVCLVSAFSGFAAWMWAMDDDRAAVLSAALVVFVVCLVAAQRAEQPVTNS
jgi:hypothetical protein